MNERKGLNIMPGLTGDLSPEQIRSRENMARLGREYHESADKLKERVIFLKEMMKIMPQADRKIVEARIALLEQEIRESKRTGNAGWS